MTCVVRLLSGVLELSSFPSRAVPRRSSQHPRSALFEIRSVGGGSPPDHFSMPSPWSRQYRCSWCSAPRMSMTA